MSRKIRNIALGVSLLALTACATSGDATLSPRHKSGTRPVITQIDNTPDVSGLNERLAALPSSNTPAPDQMDVISRSAYWGTRYDRNPTDMDTAVNYSKALRAMGSNEEALKVMNRFAETVGSKPAVNLELGKVLIANDRAFEAVRPLQKALLGGEKSWQAYSAYGVALDKIGQHEEARRQYDEALALSPGNPNVLNNKGLSLALSGKLRYSEGVLRQATGSPQATALMRQNLALVLGFAGKTGEAERLARSDLPPRVADNNVAYYRSLMGQPAYWQEFTGDNVDLPDFGTEVIDPPRAAKMEPLVESEPLPATPVRRPAAAPTLLQPTQAAPAQSTPAAEPKAVPQPQPKPAREETPTDQEEEVLSAIEQEEAQG